MSTKFFKKKAIISGNQVELYEYEHAVSYGHSCKIKGGRKPGQSGNSKRSKEYRERRNKKAKNDLIRLINTNFTDKK